MCRWMAYIGEPLRLEQLLFRPAHSIVDQSLSSTMGAETTNGDGFGVGWYVDELPEPGRYRSVEPAWNDANLRELAGAITTGCMLAHVRAAIGSPVQLTNCHPFRHEELLFMHNGAIGDFQLLHRQLLMDVDPALFGQIRGSTDSELMFMLAVGYGLREQPRRALERMVDHVEQVARDVGVEPQVQMTVLASNGESMFGARYATSETPRSLYQSADVDTLQRLYPDLPVLREARSLRLVVSEPLVDLPGAWVEVPSHTFFSYDRAGRVTHEPFEPAPVAAMS